MSQVPRGVQGRKRRGTSEASSRRIRRRPIEEKEEEEEEEEGGEVETEEAVGSSSSSSLQPTSQPIPRQGRDMVLSHEEDAKLVAATTRYILFEDRRRFPIRKTDLAAKVFPHRKRVTTHVLCGAQQQLRDVFGFTLEDVRRKSAGSAVYIVKNCLNVPDPLREALVKVEGQEGKLALVSIIAAIIWMRDGKVEEGDLWNLLETLGFKRDEMHRHLGNVKELVEKTFPRQMYFDRVREGETYIYSTGARTQATIPLGALYEIVTNALGEASDPMTAKEVEAETRGNVEAS